MAINLVQTIGQYLAPQIVSRLASALNVDSALIQRLVDATMPAVLGALGSVAATPAGAQRIADKVAAQPSDVLDKLAGAIGGEGQASAVSSGIQALSGLLGGGSSVQALSGALAKFVGVPSSIAESVVGLAAPAALGSVAKLGSENWSSGSAIARLFASQKDAISAAMPPQLASSLNTTGLLSGLQGLSTQAQGRVSATASAASAAAAKLEPPASGMGFLKWIVAAVVALAVLWWFFGGQGPNVANEAKNAATEAVKSAENLKVGAVDMGSTLKSATDDLSQTLKSVTDAVSAKAALPKLQDSAAQIDKIGALINQLPASGKAALAALIKSARPSLDALIAKVLAIPGVGPVVKPSIDDINAKLDKLQMDAG